MAKDGGKHKDREKDKEKGRGKPAKSTAAVKPSPVSTGAGEARVAAAMGATSMGPIAARPALPDSREELLQLWNEARRRRQSAPVDSEEFIQASEDVGRIEVAIAGVERAMTPPRV